MNVAAGDVQRGVVWVGMCKCVCTCMYCISAYLHEYYLGSFLIFYGQKERCSEVSGIALL